MKIHIHFLAVLILISIQSSAQQYFPASEWQTKKPEEIGINKKLLDSAINIVLQNENAVDFCLWSVFSPHHKTMLQMVFIMCKYTLLDWFKLFDF